MFNNLMNKLSIIYVSFACLFRFFEGASGQPIYLDDLQCGPADIFLINCPHPGIGNHNCAHGEDVGLRCAQSK